MNEIKIKLPSKEEIFKRGIKIRTAGENQSWEKSQLEEYADCSGVYIFYSNKKFIYCGKTTTGKWGTFAERIRRHCQFSSAQNSKVYQALAASKHDIFVSMFKCDEIEKFIHLGLIQFKAVKHKTERCCLLFEQGLIAFLDTLELNIK